jgi:hypothetical protein
MKDARPGAGFYSDFASMFCAFLVYAVEDYSKIPEIEEFLRSNFHGVVRTTSSPVETKAILENLEKRCGFMDWKDIPEVAFNLAATEMHLNVNPYHITWGITFAGLRDKFGIEWARFAVLK